MRDIWEVLARLAAYPDEHVRADVRATLENQQTATPAGAAAIGRFLDATGKTSLSDLQEQYTAAFDFDPACALDIGWHLFGESRERGAFLAALRADLDAAAVTLSVELPDHLTHVLALLSRDDTARAALRAGLVAPAVGAIEQALVGRGSPYAHVLAAVRAELTCRAGAPVNAASEGGACRAVARGNPASQGGACRAVARGNPASEGGR
jgi:nitrate reductase delta subunit